MNYETILVKESHYYTTITFNRAEEKNSITSKLLHELNLAFDHEENRNSCKVIVLEGSSADFCAGMDFPEVLKIAQSPQRSEIHNWATLLMATLKRVTTIPKIVMSKIEGNAFGGGVGLAAASDLVIATRNAQFSLPEALWGLLPAMITPFLIRRIGFQKTYALTQSSYTIKAEEALSCQLVDELSDNIEETLKRRLRHFDRLEVTTIQRMKAYFQKMWSLSPEMERDAIDEITRLLKDPTIQMTISNFVEHQKLPWVKN